MELQTIKKNTAPSTTTDSEFYDPWAEHSKEDIATVVTLATEEQKRRIADTEGENQRRIVAGQVSDMFTRGLRATWFQRGSSFVLSLLGSVRQSGKGVLNSQPVRVLNARMQIAGQKSVAAVQDLGTTVANKAGDVGLKAQETARDIKEKGFVIAQDIKGDVSSKAQETALDIKRSIVTTPQEAKAKVQEITSRLKRAVTSTTLYRKLNKSFSNLAENTNMTFAFLEEENERAWRMNSPTETYAIMNAMAVSRLIKDLSVLYRPESEPSLKYFTLLLEETERTRRVHESDKLAVTNAKTVSLLITSKFSTPVAVTSIPAAKVEIVEEIKVSKPLVATM